MRTYEDGGIDDLFRPSSGDRIIGSEEAKRSTKTFISSERSAITLALIENHAKAVIKNLQRLVHHEEGVQLTPIQVVERFSGAKRWVELHQMLVEHFASTEGFSVQAVVRMEQAKLLANQHRAESSITTGDHDGPSS